MPDILHLDYETYSDADLRKVGAFRYANDPSTVILCAAIALNDGEPLTWIGTEDGGTFQNTEALSLFLRASCEPDLLIYAHNAMFEIAITDALWRRTFGFAAPQHMQWRCTAAMARKAALPAALGLLAQTLHLRQQKDGSGKSLIAKFCKPQRPTKKRPDGGRLMPAEDQKSFDDFVAYCVQDVRTEQAVHEKLKAFEWKGSSLEMFQLDIAINTRGLPVNLEGLKAAQAMVELETEKNLGEFRKITRLNPTQGAKFLAWLKERGYTEDNLQAKSITKFLADDEEVNAFCNGLDEEDFAMFAQAALEDEEKFRQLTRYEVYAALRLKQRVAFASIKKIPTMLACAGPHDNRVRGTHICHGPTTGRWAGSLIQPQNFKRPTMDQTEQAYADICGGMSAADLEMFYGSPLEVLSSCMRHFIHDTKTDMADAGASAVRLYTNVMFNRPMLDADYAAIEGRIVCWLAGQEDALEEYRLGLDRYKIMASVIFNKPVDSIAKDQRFIGKQAVLGCGYAMGPPKFRGTCENLGFHKLPKGMEYVAVHAFRRKHPKLSAYPDENGENAGLWHQAEQSCLSAIRNPGTKYHIGPHCRAFSARTAGMHCLFIVLPSGRALCYPEVMICKKLIPAKASATAYRMVDGELVEYKTKATPARWVDQITFFGNIKGTKWGRCSTYGGSLVENCLAGQTQVLTFGRGWISLDDLRMDDKVYDGVEWVHHEGLMDKGFQSVGSLKGIFATPDHMFLRSEEPAELGTWWPASKWRQWEAPWPRHMQVYDILNCGPRNCFMVRGHTGGKRMIAHNCTQAVAADIMANGACNAERAGYEIAALIHDEALAYYAPEKGQSIREFISLLTTLPKWADGLPIEAEGDVVPFYKK